MSSWIRKSFWYSAPEDHPEEYALRYSKESNGTTRLVSMTFGRPTTAACFFADDPLSQLQSVTETDFEKVRLQFSSQSLKLSLLLDDILWRMYQPWKNRHRDERLRGSRADETASLDAIVELDAQLDDFERSVPYFLSWLSSSPSEGIAAEDQQTIAIQKNVLYARSVVRKPLRNPLSHTG